MTVYKAFRKIIKKNLFSILLYAAIFLGITFGMTNLGGNDSIDKFKEEKIKVTIIDRDKSDLSRGISNFIDDSQTLAPLEDDKEVWTDELFNRNTEYILIIPENFETDFIGGKSDLLSNYKLPNSISGNYIDRKINQFLSTVSAYLNSGKSASDSMLSASEDCSLSTNISISAKKDISGSGEKPLHYYFFQYLSYVFICMILLGLGPVLLAFKSPKLKRRMDCSALSISKRNTQLLTASIVFTFICWILFMILGAAQFSNIVSSKEYLLLVLNSFVFVAVSLSITYLATQFIGSKSALNPVANIVGLGSSFLCGVFVPQFLLSDSVLRIGQFLPPYWYIKALDSAFANDTNSFFSYLLIEVGFAIAFICLALVVSRQKLMSKH